MKYIKMIPFTLVLICIFSLINTENTFEKKQNLLVLESNEFLSNQHIVLDKDIEIDPTILESSDNDYRIYGTLERTPKLVVIAFFATNYKNINMPLKSGSFFSDSRAKEALVGESVKTYTRNGCEYYQYKDKTYYVIGKLGLSSDSPLKRHVLINDKNLLEKSVEPLIFDGANLKALEAFNGFHAINKGVERWFNISFILKWISITTWIVSIFAASLASYFYFLITKELSNTKHQIGLSLNKILVENIVILTGITSFISILLRYLLIPKDTFLEVEYFISMFIIYATLIIVFVVFSVIGMRKEALND